MRYLLPFFEHVNRIFLHLLYLNEDYIFAHDSPFKIVYHSYEDANPSPYCIGDPKQDPNDSHSQASTSPSQKTIVMTAARYAPLNMQAPLHVLPHNYGQRLPEFDGTEPTTTQKHINKMNDFADLEEVDRDDVRMRLLAQSLSGEVRKWYRSLTVVSINNFQ